MDYEKAYNEALERAQKATDNGMVSQNFVDDIFPLRDSEDERIRKAIIHHILYETKLDAATEHSWVAYLEKHKGQKPKFYPGDVVKCTSTGSLWVRCKGGDNIRSDGHTACIGGGFELASKEEVVQFFKELTENGYQWDCIKGRPMKKEQKPAECIGDSVKFEEGFNAGRESGLRDGQKYVLDNLDSYGLCKPAEWSEEDERIRGHIIDVLTYYAENHSALTVAFIKRDIDWLKSRRPQPKQEWSEEDEKIMDEMRETFINLIGDKPDISPNQKWSTAVDFIDRRLKSLRPQSSWKPSEEQMKAVICAIEECGYNSGLESLYNDLKKL